jgi:hypothetical protein
MTTSPGWACLTRLCSSRSKVSAFPFEYQGAPFSRICEIPCTLPFLIRSHSNFPPEKPLRASSPTPINAAASDHWDNAERNRTFAGERQGSIPWRVGEGKQLWVQRRLRWSASLPNCHRELPVLDMTHALVVSHFYNLPFDDWHSARFSFVHTLKGWQLGGTTRLTTGLPVCDRTGF